MDDLFDGLREPIAPPPSRLNLHNGTYTVSSPKGGHRTFRVRTAGPASKIAGERIVEMKADGQWVGLAFWDDEDQVAIVWRKHRSVAGTRALGQLRAFHWPKHGNATEKALAIFLDLAVAHLAPERGGYWQHEGYSVALAGTCVRCNRELTNPESIRAGIGPECAARTA